MPPNSHPFTTQAKGLEADLRVGTCQVPLMTSVRLMLKSERARVNLKPFEQKAELLRLLDWCQPNPYVLSLLFLRDAHSL
jgi:hypothetical protein